MPVGPNDQQTDGLLAAGEPAPFYVHNAASEVPILLVCDHASCRIPAALGDMGLDPFARRCHLAIDIGAGPLTECLSDSLGVTAVVAQYSRLVIDLNREILDPSAFLEFGDGIVVPGNRNLSRADKEARIAAIYRPYHEAVDRQLDRLKSIGPPPAFISIHSFTPVMNGKSRPWQVGVLWDKDAQMAQIFIDEFRAAGYVTGDNEPYSGKAPNNYSIDRHAEANGLPHVGIEVRQDMIDNVAGVESIATVMHRIIKSIPERIGIRKTKRTA